MVWDMSRRGTDCRLNPAFLAQGPLSLAYAYHQASDGKVSGRAADTPRNHGSYHIYASCLICLDLIKTRCREQRLFRKIGSASSGRVSHAKTQRNDVMARILVDFVPSMTVKTHVSMVLVRERVRKMARTRYLSDGELWTASVGQLCHTLQAQRHNQAHGHQIRRPMNRKVNKRSTSKSR